MADPVYLGELSETANIDVIIKAFTGTASGGNDWWHAAGYMCKISKTTTVADIRAALIAKLGEKGKAVKAFAWDGNDIVDDKTLSDNGVTLPGPAARRAGTKLEINVVIDKTVTETLDAGHKRIEMNWRKYTENIYRKFIEEPQIEVLQKARNKRKKYQLQKEEHMALDKWVASIGKRRDFKLVGPYVIMRVVSVESNCDVGSGVLHEVAEGDTVDVVEVKNTPGGLEQRGRLTTGGWITLIDRDQFIQYARFAGVRGIQPGDISLPERVIPRHFFERVSEQARLALERLLTASDGGMEGAKVLQAFHVDNTDMRFRYEKLKERMRKSKQPMKREPNRLTKMIEQEPNAFGILGKCDASINENRLWHGTGVKGAVGISNNGWDIDYCLHNAFGLGFYFSDKASVSWHFAGSPNSVGKHSVTCMFLSRVVVGRTKPQPQGVSSDPSDPIRNALYDNTRGNGGLLDPDATYHTLSAADGSYFVIMDAMQCYPEYILFCEHR
jgi:hypothetical protein